MVGRANGGVWPAEAGKRGELGQPWLDSARMGEQR